tara:strand:- start:227 stop:478 length:252 start_codon:yes stop_codon:yes gene_type:complete
LAQKPKKIKLVQMQGRSERLHYAVECTPDGKYSYLLCRGFPSVGKHEHIPSFAKGDFPNCAQCERILKKMKRQKGQVVEILEA